MNTPWHLMYRGHTCFKMFMSVAQKMEAGNILRARSSEIGPCRVCRAHWRQVCANTGANVEFTWPTGFWGPPYPGIQTIHNQIHTQPFIEKNEMLVIAEENQRLAIWGIHPGPLMPESAVFQCEFVNGKFGMWQPLSMSYMDFLSRMTVWNLANGLASITVFGKSSSSTIEALARITELDTVGDVQQFETGDARILFIREQHEIYLYGDDLCHVREVAHSLKLQWSDIESSDSQ